MQETHGLTISKSEFAAAIGVSPGRVSQMVRDGLPVEANGGVNVDSGKAWVAENVDPRRRRALLDDEPMLLTATVTEDARLLEIPREDFYDLLADHSEVMQNIFHALVRRIRKLIEK